MENSYKIVSSVRIEPPAKLEKKEVFVSPVNNEIAIGRSFNSYGRPAIIAVFDTTKAVQHGDKLAYGWVMIEIDGVFAYYPTKELDVRPKDEILEQLEADLKSDEELDKPKRKNKKTSPD